MNRFFDALYGINKALAVLSGVLLGLTAIVIALDVIARTVGLQPPPWTIAGSEFIMLYVTVLGAPYMVRIKGHVFVEALIMTLPARARRVIEKIIYALCLALSLFLAWYALNATINAFATGDFDMRGFDMPWGWVYGPMTLGLVLTGLEFLRYLIGSDSMYADDAIARDSF
ncbi:MAG TPA: TRAP transporter small permease [Alphaproteobacteria bacterium]